MSQKPLPKLKQWTSPVADENCFVEQVVNSIFDHVTADEIGHRSDRHEILRFSSSILENEIIFGSAEERVLRSANQRISQKLEKVSGFTGSN